MKKKIFIITILVMGLFAVQGYAQRENGRNQSHRVERSSNRSMSSGHSLRSSPSRNFSANQNSRSYRHSDVGDRGVRHYAPGRPNVDRNRPGALRYQRPPSGYHHRHMPPPPSHSWRPIFHHHHGFRHYHHHCYFNDWYWYRWGGHYNRFICHALYHNRFFDSLLGYYIWGALDAPTRLEIGNMVLTRYQNRLKIQSGNSVSFLDLYRHQTVSYSVGYTDIEVTTGNGSALVRFYDDYGNEATYCL